MAIVELKRLSVENYRAVGTRVEIDLAPITLFFGPNSVGKSSLLNSLDLLANEISGASLPSVGTKAYRAGRQFEILTKLAYSPPGYRLWGVDGPSKKRLAPVKQAKPDDLDLSYEMSDINGRVQFGNDNAWVEFVGHSGLWVEQSTLSDEEFHDFANAFRGQTFSVGTYEWDIEPQNSDLPFATGLAEPKSYPTLSIEWLMFSDAFEDVKNWLKGIIHLGADRTRPRPRVVNRSPLGLDPRSWTDGGAAWDLLEAETSFELTARVNEWLHGHLQTGHRLHSNPARVTIGDETFSWRETFVEDIETGVKLGLNEVGTGISHIVPILVAAFSDVSNTLVVEQPELHVHPALQATLGDLLIESMQTKRKRWIVETHSEHLLLRLMRRIRETPLGRNDGYNLTADDVAIYYCSRGKKGLEVKSFVPQLPTAILRTVGPKTSLRRGS
ncbi:MAG: AAA family ATPase [bacterium]